MQQTDELLPKRSPQSRTLQWLIVSALITVVIWQMPFGELLLYPFTILATWFHEMGHGLTALLLGGRFYQLQIFADGSGLAYHGSSGRLASALVAAGGLLGPPIAGSLLILSGRSPGSSRWLLKGLGLVLLLSTLIWVRSIFGWISLPLMGICMLIVASRGPDWLAPMLVQFLGVQACISTYRQLDYLFMASANINGNYMPSDTGQIAAALLLPYWLWGALIAGFSFVLLAGSLWLSTRPAKNS